MWAEVWDISGVNFSLCEDCGALVSDNFQLKHEQFHNQLEEMEQNLKSHLNHLP